jgi:hypothetical protein
MRKRYNPNKLYRKICKEWNETIEGWEDELRKKVLPLLALGKEDQTSGYQLVVSLGDGGICEFLEPINDKFRLKHGVPLSLGSLILEDVSAKSSIWYPLYADGFFSELLYPMNLMPNGKFYMGVYEVTQDLYETVMGKNPSYFKGGSNPVEKVNWHEAIKFCNKLSELEGLEPVYTTMTKGKYQLDETIWNKEANGYRLPSEKEWVYAAQGGEDYEYAGSDNLDEVAWYLDNSDEKSHPVGLLKPNGFGLFDMSGNVFEWVWDIDPNDGDFRVIRGGHWDGSPSSMRASYRYGYYPSYRGDGIGFRLARNA